MATYTMQVINVGSSVLQGRASPSLSAAIKAKKPNGSTFKSSNMVSSGGFVWYQDDSSGYWYCYRKPTGIQYLKVINPSSNSKETTARNDTRANSSNIVISGVNTQPNTVDDSKVNRVANDNKVSPTSNSVTSIKNTPTRHTYSIVNSSNFPKKISNEHGGEYDYSTDVRDITVNTTKGNMSGDEYIKEIRENLNIYSAWSKLEINNKYHTEFNRFKLDHPDIFMRNTIGYIIFTRPDLNIYENGQIRNEMSMDVRCEYIIKHNKHVAQALTHEYDGKAGHNFNPLLSNLAQGIDVSDDSVDTLDTGETFVGYKMQYSKHNIKSLSGGTITVKFKETFDLSVTNLFQLWVDYQSNVYRGAFTPKDDYIWYRNIDYMCNVYYFLLDQDGETVLFWTKYFGVFPQNVPKSTFSYDMGSQVQLPEVSVTFSYVYKEDLSPMTLVELNDDAGVQNAATVSYVPTYNANLGISGKTWVGVPFVTSVYTSNGIVSDAYSFKLRFRATDTLQTNGIASRSDSTDAASYAARLSSDLSKSSNRELVQFVTNFEDQTMNYLDSWNWSDALYAKLATCIKNKSAKGMTGTPRQIFQKVTGFQNNTMEYIDKYPYANELYNRAVQMMK